MVCQILNELWDFELVLTQDVPWKFHTLLVIQFRENSDPISRKIDIYFGKKRIYQGLHFLEIC